MVVSMLFLLVLFVGVVANVGQAVNRRIALQLVADTGAYSGATQMGVIMNSMAAKNGAIQDLWRALTWVSAGLFGVSFTLGECISSEAVALAWEIGQPVLYNAIRLLNMTGRLRAVNTATHQADWNAQDLFPGETLEYFTDFDAMARAPELMIKPSGFELLGPIEDVGTGQSLDWTALNGDTQDNPEWACCSCCFYCDTVSASTSSGFWWKREKDADPSYFVFVARAPAVPAVAFDWFFRPIADGAIPEMTAMAAAKAVGGNLEKADNSYIVKMLPMKQFMYSDYILDTKFSPPRLQHVVH
jgi:hypothetical protein